MEEAQVQKFLSEYKEKKALYKRFAEEVSGILQLVLGREDIKHQPITHREKELDSLAKKLRGRTTEVSHITDLAGCRVIFYLESAITPFKRFIYEEFEVVKDELHHSDSGYNGVNMVVKLKPERMALSEYAEFKDLECEIQLTTVLFHAWSEMEHDIIYKTPAGLSEFDEQAVQALKDRFAGVMKDHIKQASYSFEFIHSEFQRIKEGKRVFDLEFLKEFDKSDSLNEIYEHLKLLAEYVRKFGDKTPKELNIIGLIRGVFIRAKTLKKQPIKTEIGNLEGHEYSDVANICFEILTTLRYWHSEAIFELLIELVETGEPSFKNQALEVLDKLCDYDLHVLEKAGYGVQIFVLEKIEKWEDESLVRRSDAVIHVAEKLLEPSFEGRSWQDWQTMTFSSGALNGTPHLRDIRKRALAILERLFILGDFEIKKQVLAAMRVATQFPHQGLGDELKGLILDDINQVVVFYIKITNGELDHRLMEDVEEHMHQLNRSTDRPPGLDELDGVLASNEEYQYFRTFVGYDGRISADFDYEREREERTRKIEGYVRDLSSENFEEWEKRILNILKTYSPEGEYRYLQIFLEKLAEGKPLLASRFIQRNEDVLDPVLLDLIGGLWKSKKAVARKLVKDWIQRGKFVALLGSVFLVIPELEKPLFQGIVSLALRKKNIRALNGIINTIAQNYPKRKDLRGEFMKAIRKLTELKDYSWPNYIWFRKESILESLTEKEFVLILKNLEPTPRIDFHTEEILKHIAQRYPARLIKFFETRVERQSKTPRKIRSEFDALPFQLHELSQPLREKEDVVIPMLFQWFEKKGKSAWLFRWEAGQLIGKIFPGFGTKLEAHLLAFIESGNRENVNVVFNILRSFEGQEFLWNICKAVIKKYAKHKDYRKIRGALFGYLSQTGVVSGHYGFVEAYTAKKDALQPLKENSAGLEREFLADYERYLEAQIVHETKRADDDIALRKMQGVE